MSPPLIEKAASHNGIATKKKKLCQSGSQTISCNYLHFSGSHVVVSRCADTPKETPRAVGEKTKHFWMLPLLRLKPHLIDITAPLQLERMLPVCGVPESALRGPRAPGGLHYLPPKTLIVFAQSHRRSAPNHIIRILSALQAPAGRPRQGARSQRDGMSPFFFLLNLFYLKPLRLQIKPA